LEKEQQASDPNIPLISIVDDDHALRNSLENLIRSIGWRVACFSSAEAFLRSNQVDQTRCLVLDVRMPGMSGLELQHQMTMTNLPKPIIFITAHENENWRTQALQAGAIAFLYKPFYEKELIDAIDAALQHS
jgi:FixJ family two-component response regulator